MSTFFDRLRQQMEAKNSLLCVGIDPDTNKMPTHLIPEQDEPALWTGPLYHFSQSIVAATALYACAVKINDKFFINKGSAGLAALERLMAHIKEFHPSLLVIIDSKTEDIGNSCEKEVEYYLDTLGADAMTIGPYMGAEAFESALARKDKGFFVLCRTSNKGGGEFQSLDIADAHGELTQLFMQVAANVAMGDWAANQNVGVVVGATRPEEMHKVREMVGDSLTILAPGIGKQGGDLEQTIRNGSTRKGLGLLVNVSSDICFASSGEDFVKAAIEKARFYRDEINKYR